jgi:hypothetical protein
MLPTTIQIIKSGLQGDPSISPADRARILAIIRSGPEAPKTEPAADEPRLIRRTEAAQRLSCSLRTIDKVFKHLKRRLPGRQRSAGILESDLAALLK